MSLPDLVATLLRSSPLLALFLCMALGLALGGVRVRGLSLGASGVLFAALAMGHIGARLPVEVEHLGAVLFVYGIGLGAGPRFFRAFRERGLTYSLLALLTVLVAAATAVLVERIFGFGAALTTGIFAGALTTTPGLAAALEALGDPLVSVGYGVAYPFGVVGVVLFVQLVPRLGGEDVKAEARRIEDERRPPAITDAWFQLRDETLVGTRLADAPFTRSLQVILTRLARGGETRPVGADLVFQAGDRLRAVGREDDLARLEKALGPRLPDFVEPPSEMTTYTIAVSRDEVAGKRLVDLHLPQRHAVVVTRLWRDDHETLPRGGATLELGDTVRVVGRKSDCEAVAELVGRQERRLQETPLLPLALGLATGVAAGLVTLPLPWVDLRLGVAGGPLLVALILGRLGRLGPLVFRIPVAARVFIREMGLLLFLAGAGTRAGAQVVAVLAAQGPALLFAGALLTLVPLAVGYAAAARLGVDTPSRLGLMCGAMTSTPGLGAVRDATDSELPALAYATVYPVALIAVSVAAQLLALSL